MKRTPLARRTPLKRRAWLQRRTRLRPINPERRQRMRTDPDGHQHTYGDYHRFVSKQPCLLRRVRRHHCIGEVSGHHIRTVGAGGRDYEQEVPLCAMAHLSHDHLGRETFERRWGVSLKLEAERLAELYEGRSR